MPIKCIETLVIYTRCCSIFELPVYFRFIILDFLITFDKNLLAEMHGGKSV